MNPTYKTTAQKCLANVSNPSAYHTGTQTQLLFSPKTYVHIKANKWCTNICIHLRLVGEACTYTWRLSGLYTIKARIVFLWLHINMCSRALFPLVFHSAQISSSLSVCTPWNVGKHCKRSDSRTKEWPGLVFPLRFWDYSEEAALSALQRLSAWVALR